MTVSVANTNLNDSFNSWRLNTNFAATVISNNAVTVSRAGSANRGGYARGNGHVDGTFTANELRATTIKAGNTSNDGAWLYVNSNTVINATSLAITSNTVFSGNVNFTTSGTDRIILGDISRIRVTGGSQGQFLRIGGSSDTPDFKALTLRDIADLSTNSAPIILSGSNATYSDNGDSPALILAAGGGQRAYFYMSANTTLSDKADVFLQLSNDTANATFTIVNASNTEQFTVRADGTVYAVANLTVSGINTDANILPQTDDSVDLGAPNREFKDGYFDGTLNTDILYVATGATQGVAASLIPVTDAAGNLGSATRKWGTAWADATNGGVGTFKSMGISGAVNANGNMTVGGTGSITGATSIANTLAVTGDATFAETVTVTGNTAISDRLDVAGNTALNGDVELGNASTDTITVKGNFANQSTTGLAQFNGSVDLGNATSDTLTITARVDSNFDPASHDTYKMGSNHRRWNEVWANTVIANNVIANSNLTVVGDLTVSGATTIASGQAFSADDGTFTTLTVTGKTELDGDVDIGNASGDTISVIGSIDTNLIPTGSQDIGSSSSEWNNAYFTGTVKTDKLTVDETSTFTGAATFNSDVDVNSIIGDNLNIAANTDIDGTLSFATTTVIGKNGKIHANNAVTANTITSSMLANTMNVSNTYGAFHGGASQIPVIRVNKQGQIIAISNTTVAGVTGITYTQSNNNFRVTTATGVTYDETIDSATTTSGTGRGVASFDSGDFSVSSGHVSLADSASGAVIGISATTNETTVSRTNGTVTIGLPDDVSITSDLTVGDDVTIGNKLTVGGNTAIGGNTSIVGNLVVGGNLTVSGTVTTVNTEEINLADNIIALNSNHSGAPTQNGGITVNRGSSANAQIQWNETDDVWEIGNHGGTFYDILKNDGTYATNTHVNTLGATKMSVANTRVLVGTRLGSNALVTLTGDVTGTAKFSSNSVTISTDVSFNYVGSITPGNLIDVSGDAAEGYAVTVDVDLSEATDMTADVDGSEDEMILLDNGAQRRKLISEIKIGQFYTANQIELATDTTGNYVAGITPGSGIDVSGSGSEQATVTIAVESDLRGEVTQLGFSTSDYYVSLADSHEWYTNGAKDMMLSSNGQLDVEGDIVAQSTAISSDLTLKDNILKIDNALDKVLQLNGVEFTWKKDGSKSAGVIAQDVEKVLPQAVKEVQEMNGEGTYKTVKYDALHALLIEAIRELKAEIDELKSNK